MNHFNVHDMIINYQMNDSLKNLNISQFRQAIQLIVDNLIMT